MSGGELLAGLLAFVGAGAGAFLSFWAARRATAQQESQSRREEWGRRFTAALEMVADTDARQQIIGHALLGQLVGSELATAEERELAEQILLQSSRAGLRTDLQGILGTLHSVDDLVVVEDDGDDEGGRS